MRIEDKPRHLPTRPAVISAARRGAVEASQSKVNALRRAIADGTFEVNPVELARRILEHEEALSLCLAET